MDRGGMEGRKALMQVTNGSVGSEAARGGYV
jgi:hypothetical protein